MNITSHLFTLGYEPWELPNYSLNTLTFTLSYEPTSINLLQDRAPRTKQLVPMEAEDPCHPQRAEAYRIR